MRLLLRLDHELKNPLQALRLTVASAADGPAQALPVVAAQADRIGGLFGDLRKLAELERRQLDLGPVDLAALLTEVRDDVTARPGGFQRQWSVTLPTAPWPVPTLTADPDLVYLAVRNLADNALKYSRPGDSIDLRVSEPNDGWVLVEIADTGLGVPVAEQQQVWEEFARASTSRTLPGTGMGLPLVRTVARRHGGTATCAPATVGAPSSACGCLWSRPPHRQSGEPPDSASFRRTHDVSSGVKPQPSA